jgi:hypothetical protein
MWRGHSCPRSAINSSVSTQSLSSRARLRAKLQSLNLICHPERSEGSRFCRLCIYWARYVCLPITNKTYRFDPCNPCKSVAKKFVSAPVISVTTLSTFVDCQAIFFQPLSTHSPARKSTCARPDPYWPRIVKIEIRVLNSRPCRSIFRHLSHPAKPLFRKILRISSLLARFYAEWPGSEDSNRHQIMDLAKSIRKKHVALSVCGGRL